MNITNWARNTAVFSMGGWTHYETRAWVTFATQDSLNGEYQLGTFTIQCVNARGESCETSLKFVTPSKLFDHTGKSVAATWTEGTFGCNRTLDTGAGGYPSISGTHNGTITPNRTIKVQKLYTYPCAGTGGHTEYAKFYNDTWSIESQPWVIKKIGTILPSPNLLSCTQTKNTTIPSVQARIRRFIIPIIYQHPQDS